MRRAHTRARGPQNNNHVYTLAEEPSWDNVIALIIRRRGNRYHCILFRLSDVSHPSDAHPATSRRTVIRAKKKRNTHTHTQKKTMGTTSHSEPRSSSMRGQFFVCCCCCCFFFVVVVVLFFVLCFFIPRPVSATIAGHIPMGKP